MPKPVTSKYSNETDWSPPEGNSDEICNEEFHFPKKLSEMSDQEKEQLYQQYLIHSKTVMNDDVAELTPTQVVEGRKKVKPKPAKVTVDKGIVVPGEDFDVLKGLVGEEQASKMMSRPVAREVDEGEAQRKEMASKTSAERNALARFNRI